MNKTKIEKLLQQWSMIIDTGEQTSKTKAEALIDGLNGRIKRTTGQPVVFDCETHEGQTKVQDSLCKELPQWSDLIRSQPDIMDGYSWTRSDFIQLYFEHFRLVVEKLKRIIDQKPIRKDVNNE